MEFRDGPSLTKEPVSLPDSSWQWPLAPTPDTGMATVPLSALGSSYISQFQLTFHLPVLGGLGRNAHLGALLGSTRVPTPSLVALPIHSTSKGLPSAHPLRSLPMLCSPYHPSPYLGAHIFLGPRSHGGRGQVGGPGGRVGGRGRDAQLPHFGARWGGVQRKVEGCLAGTFLSFISRFFCI